jgi:magnesium-transporting ATPase (P-type)
MSVLDVFTAHGVSNILLAVCLMAVFVSIFFFTYGSYMEKKIVNNQTKFLVDTLASETKPIILSSKHSSDAVNNAIANIKAPDMTEQDTQAKESNQNLVKESVIVISIVTAVIMTVIFSLWYMSNKDAGFFKKFDIKEVFIHNSIIILAVAVTEFLFTTLVIGNYISVDPNNTVKRVIENFKNWGKNC